MVGIRRSRHSLSCIVLSVSVKSQQDFQATCSCCDLDVLDDLKVQPVSEDLPKPVETPKNIKNEPDVTDENVLADIYGATPQRQIQPAAEAVEVAAPAAVGNMAAFQDLLMTLGLTDEEKRILAQQLVGGVNNTAQVSTICLYICGSYQLTLLELADSTSDF